MFNKPSSVFAFLATAVLLLNATLAAEPNPSNPNPSNKWRLQCSGGANSDGTIVLLISPEGGTPIEASIAIKDGTGENSVAAAIVKGLKATLPKDHFKVERDDGEDVLIKKRGGAPDFAVTVVSIDVKGVRISPEHE